MATNAVFTIGNDPPGKIHFAKLAFNKYQILIPSETFTFGFTGFSCNLKIYGNDCLHLSPVKERKYLHYSIGKIEAWGLFKPLK